jgi:hypothetical protein
MNRLKNLKSNGNQNPNLMSKNCPNGFTRWMHSSKEEG